VGEGRERARSVNGSNGIEKDPKTGRFLLGNKGGPGGNPEAARVRAYRMAFLRAAKPRDVRRTVLKLAKLAEAGEEWAARELLNRCLGKSKETLAVEVKHEGDLRRGEELLGIIERQNRPEEQGEGGGEPP